MGFVYSLCVRVIIMKTNSCSVGGKCLTAFVISFFASVIVSGAILLFGGQSTHGASLPPLMSLSPSTLKVENYCQTYRDDALKIANGMALDKATSQEVITIDVSVNEICNMQDIKNATKIVALRYYTHQLLNAAVKHDKDFKPQL